MATITQRGGGKAGTSYAKRVIRAGLPAGPDVPKPGSDLPPTYTPPAQYPRTPITGYDTPKTAPGAPDLPPPPVPDVPRPDQSVPGGPASGTAVGSGQSMPITLDQLTPHLARMLAADPNRYYLTQAEIDEAAASGINTTGWQAGSLQLGRMMQELFAGNPAYGTSLRGDYSATNPLDFVLYGGGEGKNRQHYTISANAVETALFDLLGQGVPDGGYQSPGSVSVMIPWIPSTQPASVL